MTIEVGSKLGPYEIMTPIGAGGMGEVYRARDTRLDRQVAIKVLPSVLTASEQLRARFEREAKTISQLSHPNICTLYDVGSEGGVEFIVMEYLEGESLSQILEKGALPLDQAIRYGIQIAGALDKAHRQGVVHRDLKPGNVMITAVGAKLLDFGLAKMVHDAAPADSVTDLPTQHRDLTEEGTILGTVQYMAPEQLEGREADPRTDIFAFGALLFEMVTGRKVFQGKSRVSLMASIMEHRPPPITTLQPLAPPALERLVRTCLEKNADDRWQTAHDLELQLRWIEEGGSDAGLPAPVVARRKGRERVAWAIAVSGLTAALVFLWLWLAGGAAPPRIERFSITPGDGVTFAVDAGMAISPDGSKLAFTGDAGTGPQHLYVRAFDELEPKVVEGSQGVFGGVFWSPDGSQIGFFVDRKLKRVAASGGPPQTICDAPGGRGGTWNADGTIVFSSGTEGGRGVLQKVNAGGGIPIALTELSRERGEISHRWPWFLPDGRHVIFTAQTAEGGVENDASTIEVLSLDSGERTLVLKGNSSVQYVPTGYILFWREGSVLAQPFDPEALAVTGDAVPIIEEVAYSVTELGAFSASTEGTLVYQTGTPQVAQLTLFDRSGKALRTFGEPSNGLLAVRLSRDGSRFAFELDGDIWIRDLARGIATRLTFSGRDSDPVWSPNDEWIAYSSDRSPSGIYRRRASGMGDEELLLGTEANNVHGAVPRSWSSDGRSIVCEVYRAETKSDIDRLDVEEGTLESLVRTPFMEIGSEISPDGNWLASMSDESGDMEIYVHKLTGAGGRWQLTAAGGHCPTWSHDGRTLYYISGTDVFGGELMAVEVDTRDTFRASEPVTVMNVSPRGVGLSTRSYDVNSDGSLFLWNAAYGEGRIEPPLTIVKHWPLMLTKR